MRVSTISACFAALYTGATAMSVRQTGEAMNIVNGAGNTLRRRADGAMGWWTSSEPSAVFILWPTVGNPTALKFADGKCLHMDGQVPVVADCTGSGDEWWYYENEHMMWVATIPATMNDLEGNLVVEKRDNDMSISYRATTLPNPHEMTCDTKWAGRSDRPSCDTFQTTKMCCDHSNLCGTLHKCTESFCCEPDSSAKNPKAPQVVTAVVENPHEIYCEKKWEGRSDHPTCGNFQSNKMCCDHSHLCGTLHKCTESFCCRTDENARYMTITEASPSPAPSPSRSPVPSVTPSPSPVVVKDTCAKDAAQLGADTWTHARRQVGDSCHDLDMAFSDVMSQAPQDRDCAYDSFSDAAQSLYDAAQENCVSECEGYGEAKGVEIGQQLCRVMDLYADDEAADEGITLFVCNEKEKKACHQAYATYISTFEMEDGGMCVDGVSNNEKTQQFHDQLETACEISIGPDQ